MGKQTTYIKTINNHDIYVLKNPINGLNTHVISHNNVILSSYPSLAEAEAFANQDSPELLASLDNHIASQPETTEETFFSKMLGTVKGWFAQ